MLVVWYNRYINSIRITQGWLAHSHKTGGGAMTVFESLMLAVAFASLILALSDNQKK